MSIELPEGYRPSEDEEYMNPMQLEYFRRKLQAWKAELLEESNSTIDQLREENWQEPDINDRATLESDAALELRTRDRYRKLINKIDKTLNRIQEGDYGYCSETGEEIGLKRLEARPIANLTIEAQEKQDQNSKLQVERHYLLAPATLRARAEKAGLRPPGRDQIRMLQE